MVIKTYTILEYMWYWYNWLRLSISYFFILSSQASFLETLFSHSYHLLAFESITDFSRWTSLDAYHVRGKKNHQYDGGWRQTMRFHLLQTPYWYFPLKCFSSSSPSTFLLEKRRGSNQYCQFVAGDSWLYTRWLYSTAPNCVRAWNVAQLIKELLCAGLFKTWVVIALHNSLPLVALLFTIPLYPCFAIHSTKLII